MKKIIPNLWFDKKAEESANFYTKIFLDSKIIRTDKYTSVGEEVHGGKEGQVMTVEFELSGLRFVGINGGPHFKINPSISFTINCKSTIEVDSFWEELSIGGEVLMPLQEYPFSKYYGWLNDKYGVSWQIILIEGDKHEKVVPALMFNQSQAGKAKEALAFYTDIFPDSKIGEVWHYGAGQEPDKEGTIAHAEFTLCGQQFTAMDSAQSHKFRFNEGVSLLVECDTQEEIDTYWRMLSAVPEAEQCGWLKDKYGVSWQIAPKILNEMLAKGTHEQLEKVTAAYLAMKKFDIAILEKAYNL